MAPQQGHILFVGKGAPLGQKQTLHQPTLSQIEHSIKVHISKIMDYVRDAFFLL